VKVANGGIMVVEEYIIPSFIIAGKLVVENPKISVPVETNRVPNLLGRNILESFNYYVEHDTNFIYFQKRKTSKLASYKKYGKQ